MKRLIVLVALVWLTVLGITFADAMDAGPATVARSSAVMPTFGENDRLPEIVNAFHAHRLRTIAAELDRQAAEAEAARRAAPARTSTVPVPGSCAEQIPSGFPGWIVERESRGVADAVNSSSGTFGCAQLDPRHFSDTGWGSGTPGQCSAADPRNGGALLDYRSCVARLWDGGTGAIHWKP